MAKTAKSGWGGARRGGGYRPGPRFVRLSLRASQETVAFLEAAVSSGRFPTLPEAAGALITRAFAAGERPGVTAYVRAEGRPKKNITARLPAVDAAPLKTLAAPRQLSALLAALLEAGVALDRKERALATP
jgi:hypothetical protein